MDYRDDGTDSARAGHGIVVENDHARFVTRARRHTLLVRASRVVLPVLAVGIAVYYVGAVLDVAGFGKGLAKLEVPRILPQDLTMNNPRYRGFNPDGSSYVVEAKAARQELKTPSTVRLETISGVLTRKDGSKTNLAARSGVYDTRTELLTLLGNIRVTADDGAWARLNVAHIEPKTGLIRSKQPVAVGNKAGTIRAASMTIRQKSKEITFAGKVHATLQPAAAKGKPDAVANAPAPKTGLAARSGVSLGDVFSGGSGPIEVFADRLDIDDVKKTAVFVGNVRATRGESTLTTPELRIAYDGAPSGGLAGGSKTAAAQQQASDAGAAKIKTILAAAPVAITQGSDTRVTGRTALFDAQSEVSTIDGGVVIRREPDVEIKAPTAIHEQKTQTSRLTGGVVIDRAPATRITAPTAEFDTARDVAVVSGGVVVTSGADRRVSGERAELDNRNETVLLTGASVVLNQGRNVLKGTRLYSDQKAKRAELTAPAEAGRPAGRIAARFFQTEAAAARRRAKPKEAEEPGGFTAMSSFRTDPNAPIDVTAERLTLDEASSQAVFTGDVVVDQGGVRMKSAELTALYSGSAGIGTLGGAGDAAPAASDPAKAASVKVEQPARLTRIQARGKVVLTSANGQKATGDWADLDTKANTATVGGDVVLSQGRNVVRGTRLVVDLASGESVITTDNSAVPQLTSEKPGAGWTATRQPSRPSAVFFPQQLRETASKAAEKAGGAGGAAASSWAPVTRDGQAARKSN